MNEPGLDERHRDKDGRIELKHGNTLNKHLPRPIEGFPPDATLEQMRQQTGQTSEEGIRQAAKKQQ
jgi:hypothetical protein